MGAMKPNNPSWRFNGNERAYIEEVLSTGFRAGEDGAFTQRLESAFAESYGVPFAVAFNSGTTTLHAALVAMGCGPGDEVLTPALTPLMCGLAPHYTGATPVFVDSLRDTFLMDPADIEAKISPKTKVVFVTHMYGGVCDMEAIMRIADRHNLWVLEDCAQCHRGMTAQGQWAGTVGHVGSWSFENSKQLTCGDGGIITCNDEVLATKIRKIGGLGFKNLTAKSGRVRTDRDKIQSPDWERFELPGFNYRLGQLGAAVALAQVERTDYFIGLRQEMAKVYDASLSGSELLYPQGVMPGFTHTYYTYSARFDESDSGISWSNFRSKYMEFGGDGIYAASKLQHQEPAFRDNGIGKGETPIAVELQRSLMNFTTNQATAVERELQFEAMMKTRKYFGDNV